MHLSSRSAVWFLSMGLSMPVVFAAPDFEKDIRPILESNCVLCHGSGKQKGNLQLHTRAAMLKGGDSGTSVDLKNVDASLILERVLLPAEDDEIMPQESAPLKPEQISMLKEWVAAGAPWPEGLRLKAKKHVDQNSVVAIPDKAPASIQETASNVDKILTQENEKRDVKAAAPIEDLAFLRRSTIDLIGRIPTAGEIREFEAMSPADRREKWVEKMIDNPRFAGRWTVFYADLLRVRANQSGGNELLAWLHNSVSTNMPWDKMAYELISASGRPGQSPAVGWVLNDGADPMQLASAVSQVFLGVRMSCAQCHDHPFDDWNQKDFYDLASFFGKTVRQENQFSRTVYTTEQDKMRVQWPPEGEGVTDRKPVEPKFPFQLAKFEQTPSYIARMETKRAAEQAALAKKASEAGTNLDALLDGASPKKKGVENFDVLSEAKTAAADLKVEKDLYKPSELREQLAAQVADPRNRFFARVFVNRVWAEMNGRGFVEPLDNFSEFQTESHPQTLEYLAREFVASGYDFKQLVHTIALTKTYSRGHLPGDTDINDEEAAVVAFTASPLRRMLSESLYDSVAIAGHIENSKWRAGENIRVVSKQLRIPIVDDAPAQAAAPAAPAPAAGNAGAPALAMNMMQGGANMDTAGAGYDLEKGIEIDFAKVLSKAKAQEAELDSMRQMADAEVKKQQMIRAQMEAAARRPQRYTLKTVQEEIDDNPAFSSTLKMASPAPADHFLRVFGQPGRDELGQFRDHSASLRQQLMMLNGKVTNEAARVGSLEPLYTVLTAEKPDLARAVELVYFECLTRAPSAEEKADALEILASADSPVQGMGDLRWALMNCHEFRFIP
jgi:hypothetical protein